MLGLLVIDVKRGRIERNLADRVSERLALAFRFRRCWFRLDFHQTCNIELSLVASAQIKLQTLRLDGFKCGLVGKDLYVTDQNLEAWQLEHGRAAGLLHLKCCQTEIAGDRKHGRTVFDCTETGR